MAVYTKLTDNDIVNILQNYDIGKLESYQEIMAGVENSNFLLKTSQKKAILTIFEQRVNLVDLPFFFNLMNHLVSKSLPCPQIYLHNNSNFTFALKLNNNIIKTGAIISFLNGKALSSQEIQVVHCDNLGKMLAKLHLAGSDFKQKRSNDFNLLGINNLYQKLLKSNLITNHNQFIIEKIFFRFTENNHYNNLPKGIIHADLFPDNIFFINHEISGIIDFYFAAQDYYIYDLAITINAWCFNHKQRFSWRLFNALCNSYNNSKKLTSQELEGLQDFCLLAALRFYLTRLYDKSNRKKGDLVEIKDPDEYLQKILFFQKLTENQLINSL
jgi:homoserine kinase type II